MIYLISLNAIFAKEKKTSFGFPRALLNTISICADGTSEGTECGEGGEIGLTSNITNSSNMTEQFIQEFVANYPCDVCRGKLIVDILEAQETHRVWVHRNHVIFNQERRLLEPLSLPLPVNIGTDAVSSNITTGCDWC